MNSFYYSIPTKENPRDVEGTVICLETFSNYSARRAKRGDILELLAGQNVSNEDGIAYVRWDHDVKNWIDFGSMVIRSSNISVCNSIWNEVENIQTDYRKFHLLRPTTFYHPKAIPPPINYAIHVDDNIHQKIDNLTHTQKEKLLYNTAKKSKWQQCAVSYDAITQNKGRVLRKPTRDNMVSGRCVDYDTRIAADTRKYNTEGPSRIDIPVPADIKINTGQPQGQYQGHIENVSISRGKPIENFWQDAPKGYFEDNEEYFDDEIDLAEDDE